jgi:hypothetical protein
MRLQIPGTIFLDVNPGSVAPRPPPGILDRVADRLSLGAIAIST